MIKYIGSKRRLVGALGAMFESSGAQTALDLFTGTTRVAQEFKRRGGVVTTVDVASYSEVLSQCYIATDASTVDMDALGQVIEDLNNTTGQPGYFTETFCVASRFFQPQNGERVDAIRNRIETEYKGSHLYPILLTSLMEAADRVDSTTGVQMAYVKKWAKRSYNPLVLRVPELVPGEPGLAVRQDAQEAVKSLGHFDVAYLDPPYNQHRYFTNYHIWETLIRWDAPEHYGVACKRIDSRSDETKSVFNMRRKMPPAFFQVVRDVQSDLVVLSYNNEAWVSRDELIEAASVHGHVEVMAFDSKRYVGAQIGIYNPSGERVGEISHLRNLEYVVVAGRRPLVERVCAACRSGVREQQMLPLESSRTER